MNLLEFSKEVVSNLDKITSGKEFAAYFVDSVSKCYHEYQDGLINSNSHGIAFFQNVINHWDNPDAFFTGKKPKGNEVDYEYNFVLIIKKNKALCEIQNQESNQ